MDMQWTECIWLGVYVDLSLQDGVQYSSQGWCMSHNRLPPWIIIMSIDCCFHLLDWDLAHCNIAWLFLSTTHITSPAVGGKKCHWLTWSSIGKVIWLIKVAWVILRVALVTACLTVTIETITGTLPKNRRIRKSKLWSNEYLWWNQEYQASVCYQSICTGTKNPVNIFVLSDNSFKE